MFTRLARALEPEGWLVVNAFVTRVALDSACRQAAQTALSSAFTSEDLARASAGLALVSDEAAFAFERANTPSDAWPPTPWFESWALGRNVFDLHAELSPLELRWLVYRNL